ncbi:hypothetical protein KZZ52_52320 [Dactylosporangium sp. AC04546]|uniref:hypothetical protein n=1 Tax=Dactylosporangium sp. AC04546 TaxID=2862460 RepID=UPI001EDE43DB|nr:hypothetical protein [Dactylosporangium sp. AC04546]WVK82449.1 hypothetical protein KZZ52_52320 [Dactylosporangium sp. AC04546]
MSKFVWPAVVAGFVVGAAEFADLAPFAAAGPALWIPPAVALLYLVLALARHRLVARQLAGVVLFAAVAGVALVVDPVAGQYVVAAGWAGHAVWDWFHRDGTVIPRWIIGFCLPYDLLVAAALVYGAATIAR